ncbi:peptidase M56 [Flavobacterium plurextorum]|uniref:Peptidase M56 n=1 Tax=Flavobacterium plurextorum TaxID=1114867 RepID=A0ABX4CY48_9FLAO|nr:M56 family metallopeptidase [Flavobacterium plurextorum]OXB10592.1 peptidase M56 [Flavobacterium plurextorum]
MEALFIYIAKSTGLIVLFYCAYQALLRKETFFNSNRWFLLAGLITAVVLPLLVYTKVIWVDPAPSFNMDYSPLQSSQITQETFELNWNYILLAVYAVVFLALIVKFAFDFYSLNTILKGRKIKQQADFKFIDIAENIAPFSYFDYIVYNSSMYNAQELENIIEHEKVHSEQNHTIDVLIARIFCIIFWFNPIMWLYKKAIVQNLEFIADKEAAKKISDKKAYQYTLLKITTHETCVAITNHFYQSLIKKRIVMLNKNQSKKRNSWKYYTVIPALIAFVFLFQIEVIAKEKQPVSKGVSEKVESKDVYKIKKNSTDKELNEIKENLKKKHNIDFEFSQTQRNAENDLTSIKVDIKNGTQQVQSIQTKGDKPINSFGIVITTDKDGSKKVGIQTSDETNNSKTDKKAKFVSSTKTTTKSNTNDNTNSDVNAKADANNITNISTTVTTDTNNNVTTKVITTDGDSSTITISNSTRSNMKKGNQLIVLNGTVMSTDFNLEEIKPNQIKTIVISKGTEAKVKYGESGSNGVIEIETNK